jgi:hypothetical protein
MTVTAGSGSPASAGAMETSGSDAATGSHGLDGIANYTEDGPFKYESTRSGMVNEWVPVVPPGCRVPIVHFGNGTGAACSGYQPILERLASHGFLVTCYEDPNTAEGTECMTAIETALAEHPTLADMKVGSTGHEQGGGAALLCLSYAEAKWGDAMIYAGHAVIPVQGTGSGPSDWASFYERIKSPIFMFNVANDALVPTSRVREGYDKLRSERYWYEASGATHLPLPMRWAQESAVVIR